MSCSFRKHIENIYDLTEEEASRLFAVAPKIANALKAEFKPAGMNLLQNNGAPAGQAVFHFHLHFIPRYDETDGFKPTFETKVSEFTPERITGNCRRIRSKTRKIRLAYFLE